MGEESRDTLIDKVRLGDLTPDEAEREAARLGIDPLAGEPPLRNFAPMEEEFWSLSMAAAWIAYRTPGAVREWWEAYRAECRKWQFRPSRLGADQPLPDDHFLQRPPPATLAGILQAEANEDRTGRDPEYSMPVANAIEALLVAVRSCCFQATGLAKETGLRQNIDPLSGNDFAFEQQDGADVVTLKAESGAILCFRDVAVLSGAVTMFWPVRQEHVRCFLPPLMSPEGAGYMPLYCAAQWIATEGGAVDFDPQENDIWRPAYAALIDAMSVGDVLVSGMARGARETIDGVVFAGCEVAYPLGSNFADLMYGPALYLRGSVRNFVCGAAVEDQAAMALVKRSPKRTAN